jgi:hypothetical protein
MESAQKKINLMLLCFLPDTIPSAGTGIGGIDIRPFNWSY